MGTYVYNASGELIRLEATEGNTVFSRGELGVISSVTLPSSQSISYKTDYSARRVEKLNSTSQNYRRIYQNQLQVAAEMKGTELSEFIYATRINVSELVKKSGQTYRVITDHLGSPVLVINTADGTIEAQAQYNEWGRVIEETNAGFMPFGFAGGLRDLDTGLVRFGARDYSPNTARWISKDPIGFGGGDANLYRYVNNDPMNFYDPIGEKAMSESERAIDPIASCQDRVIKKSFLKLGVVSAAISATSSNALAGCGMTGPAAPACSAGVGVITALSSSVAVGACAVEAGKELIKCEKILE